MMNKLKRKPTLYQPAIYQIQVPGEIDQHWSDWAEGMTITVDGEIDGTPVTTLTCTLDQAALQGLVRRLYSLGLPLIAVTLVDDSQVRERVCVWRSSQAPAGR